MTRTRIGLVLLAFAAGCQSATAPEDHTRCTVTTMWVVNAMAFPPAVSYVRACYSPCPPDAEATAKANKQRFEWGNQCSSADRIITTGVLIPMTGAFR